MYAHGRVDGRTHKSSLKAALCHLHVWCVLCVACSTHMANGTSHFLDSNVANSSIRTFTDIRTCAFGGGRDGAAREHETIRLLRVVHCFVRQLVPTCAAYAQSSVEHAHDSTVCRQRVHR
eukprot:6203571-Pleurochrysis_carterae.AAC.1